MATSAEFQAGWNRMYENGAYAGMWDAEWPQPELVGFLASGSVPVGSVIVDVGCGTGSDALFFAARGYRVTGIDVSDAAIDMARQRSGQAGLDVTWLCASVFDLPLETASVDLVTDRGLLHHVPTEDHAAYATEIARVLRPGGRLLVRGMSEEGRKKVPVTEASLRRAFDTDDLVVEFVADLRMLHADGSDPATLAVVVRR